MTTDPTWLAKLKAKRDRYIEWLRRHAKADAIAPYVQKDLAMTEWQIEVIESRPAEADEIPMPDLGGTIDRDLKVLDTSLPMMPDYPGWIGLVSSAYTTSGSVSIHEYAARVGDLGTPHAVEYSERAAAAFGELNRRYDTGSEARGLVEKFCGANTLERLEEAEGSYLAYGRDTATRHDAAYAMRNLIDGIKGELFALAMTHERENMTWEIMASRLARGGPEGPQCAELLAQEARHRKLIERLSDVGHDRKGGSATDIDAIWTEVLGYLIVLLAGCGRI